MQQHCIVSSPFIENKIQLFYEASLIRESGMVMVRIFSHRGVLRNKRMIQLQKGVYEIFTAEEYLIGLDENHQRVWIVDVRKTMRNVARGVMGQRSGLSGQLKSKKLSFSKFIFDKHTNLIYAIYGGHYIFYLRINHFEDDSSINQPLNLQIAQQSKSISINRIIQSQQSIDKLQIKHQIVQKNKICKDIKHTNQQYIDKCFQAQQENENMYRENNDNDEENNQINSLICLLIKEKHIMRVIEMDWNNDKVKKVKQESNVHDFCFKNGWDLVIKLQKSAKQQMMRREQREYRVIQQQGRFDQKVTLSGEYSIFTSDQNLFIIDPCTQTIAGVYHKQWYSVTDCHSIPKSINPQNTLLMVDKPDEYYLRFLFLIFDIKQGEFHNKRVVTPLVEMKQGAQLQLFLKRNLQKIYTPNALIHPYFRDKVAKCIGSIMCREEEKMIQRSQQVMIVNNRERDVSSDDMQLDGIELGRMFLEKFIMCQKQSDNLLDRLMFSLINSGIKALFSNKDRATHQRTSLHSAASQMGNIKQPLSTSQILLHTTAIKHKLSLQLSQNQDKQNNLQNENEFYECSFSRWNGYFEGIINDQEKLLTELFAESNSGNSNRLDRSESEYSSSVGNRFSRLYDNLTETKRKLSLVSKAYNRILNFISTASQRKSSSKKQSQLNNTVNYYKQRVKININRVRSLYLLFDLFDLARAGDEREMYQEYLERIERAVIGVFKQIQYRRSEIMQQYRMHLLLDNKRGHHNKPILISEIQNATMASSNQPLLLMLHQHFTNSQLLLIPSQDITFQLFLQYLLLKINHFEQISYFYHLVKRQLIRNQNDQQELEGDVMYERMGGQIERKSHQDDDTSDQNRSYPYVNRNLINFFYLVQSVPLFVSYNNQTNEIKKRVYQAARLSMQINCTSFTNYMIQLCSLYSLPNTLVTIINLIPIQLCSQHAFGHLSSHQLSQAFLYRERLIMNCLLYCAFNLNNSSQYSISMREILIYEMKRILKVSNKIKSTINPRHDIILRKTLSMQNDQSINQQSHPTQFQSQSIKNTLLQQFITMILKKSYYQGIRLLLQLKNQCLTQEEDRERFKSTVNKITSQCKEKSLKAIKQIKLK